MPRHVVLLGDSIFDNAPYVPGEDAVIDQFRAEMPINWKATLLAKDGDVTADVCFQLEYVPHDATDLVISVGGNDALQHSQILEQANSIDEIPRLIGQVLPRFRNDYSAMLDEAMGTGRDIVVCTIYDQCPFPERRWRELVPIALGGFNDCIIHEANRRNLSVIDLRDICDESEDYSTLSPIEPSSLGGIKIVSTIIRTLAE